MHYIYITCLCVCVSVSLLLFDYSFCLLSREVGLISLFIFPSFDRTRLCCTPSTIFPHTSPSEIPPALHSLLAVSFCELKYLAHWGWCLSLSNVHKTKQDCRRYLEWSCFGGRWSGSSYSLAYVTASVPRWTYKSLSMLFFGGQNKHPLWVL